MAAVTGTVVRIQCPHCGSTCKIRSSKRISATTRDLWLACEEPQCGATYKGQMALLHVLSPPAIANPRVHLPFRPAPADRFRPPAANDDAPSAPGVQNG